MSTFQSSAPFGLEHLFLVPDKKTSIDPLSDLANRLRMVQAGTSIMSADALKQLTQKENPALKTLTPRELDIARLVAQSLSNKEIATELFLSEGTVRNNLVIIMEKMEVSNRLQLGINYFLIPFIGYPISSLIAFSSGIGYLLMLSLKNILKQLENDR